MLSSLQNRSVLFRLCAVTIAVQLLRGIFVGSLLSLGYVGQSSSSPLTIALHYAQPEVVFTLLAALLICLLFVANELQFRFLTITSASVIAASVIGFVFVSEGHANALDRLLPISTFLGDKGPSQMILCWVGFAFGVTMSLRLFVPALPWMILFASSAILGIALASWIMHIGAHLKIAALNGGGVANTLSTMPFAFVCSCLLALYPQRFVPPLVPRDDLPLVTNPKQVEG